MATIGAAALHYLSSLVYRPDATVVVGMIPFTGIYWTDEIPDHDLIQELPEDDCHQVYRVFGIRKLIWRREKLSPEQREFWELVKGQVPGCPVFQRLKPSRDVLRVDVCVEREFDAFEAAVEAEAAANSADEEQPLTVILRYGEWRVACPVLIWPDSASKTHYYNSYKYPIFPSLVPG